MTHEHMNMNMNMNMNMSVRPRDVVSLLSRVLLSRSPAEFNNRIVNTVPYFIDYTHILMHIYTEHDTESRRPECK
jgi:hypothetical protein